MKTIVAALALAIATLANSAHAEWQWKHFGVAPYATSKDEAMKTRESAFRKLGFPEQCISSLVKETEKPGVRITMKVEDRFSAQISKGDIVHGLSEGGGIVAFENPPMSGMQYAAPAETWNISCQGRVLTISLPDVCFNWTSIIGPAPAQTVPPVAITSTCPNGYGIIGNAWSLATFSADLRKQAEGHIAAANNRDSKSSTAYQADDVSRTLGGQLRREVKTRAPIAADIRIQLRDPKTLAVVQDLGTFKLVAGVGNIQLSDVQHKKIVETIWPANFISPTVSDGLHRLWVYPGEWANWCSLNVHGATP